MENLICQVCGNQKKLIPAGVSKNTGKPYNAFYSCSNRCPKVANTNYGANTPTQGNFGANNATPAPKQDVDWDKVSTGKVRHGVALKAIDLKMPLNPDTDKWIKQWTDYIMTGEISIENNVDINPEDIF